MSETSSSGFFVETKLYVTNLPDSCNQAELKSLFEAYGGNVLECVIMWNHYAFVHFSDLREAKVALKHLHGYMFNGKNLIVQLSSSSNRPLPKCLAFNTAKTSARKFSYASNDDETKQQSPTILCYRASESTNASEQQSNSRDWIKLLKTGNVPFRSEDTTKNDLVSLSGIPTPVKPDLTSKIPSSSKNIISNQAHNNINNYGFLNLSTVKKELKRIGEITSPKTEPVSIFGKNLHNKCFRYLSITAKI